MSLPLALKVLMVGSGHRALRLARDLSKVPELALAAVCSPNVRHKAVEWPGLTLFSDLDDAVRSVQPKAAIVASSNASHFSMTSSLLQRGIPTLLEKPLTATDAEAEALIQIAEESKTPLLPAHNALFPSRLEPLLGPGASATRVEWVRPATSGDRPRSWDRGELFEVLYHPIAMLLHGSDLTDVRYSRFEGFERPSLIQMELSGGERTADVRLQFDGEEEYLRLRSTQGGKVTSWVRSGRTITVDGRPIESDGGELERMLRHFRDVALGRTVPLVTLREALSVMRTTRQVLEALKSAGAPLS